jgi:hypothetical protein
MSQARSVTYVMAQNRPDPHCVADRFMPFGGALLDRVSRAARGSRLELMEAEPTYLRVPISPI